MDQKIMFALAVIGIILVLAFFMTQQPSDTGSGLITCAEHGGIICSDDQTCSTSWRLASDTIKCCTGECQESEDVEKKPMTCTITYDLSELMGNPSLNDSQDITITMSLEDEKISGRAAGGDTSWQVIGDGTNYYLNIPWVGDVWYQITQDDISSTSYSQAIMTYEGINSQIQNPQTGVTIDCHSTDDIPDSEFELPKNITVKDFADMYGDIGVVG